MAADIEKVAANFANEHESKQKHNALQGICGWRCFLRDDTFWRWLSAER